jgi:CheY-like chemotaxis protein
MSDQELGQISPLVWNILLVEDDPQMRTDVLELLDGEVVAGREVSINTYDDFDSALQQIAERRADLIILDVFRGDALQGADAVGLRVLEAIRGSGFVSVVLYTAHPEKVDQERSSFVRLVGKDVNGLRELKAEIESLFETRVPQSFRAVVEHLDTTLREYMWGFVANNWQQLEGLSGSPEFLRVLVRRLAATLTTAGIDQLTEKVFGSNGVGDIAQGKAHPAEYYIMPPLDATQVRMGDIRIRQTDGEVEYLIVLWPTCDMVEGGGRNAKTDRVLCIQAEPAKQAPELRGVIDPEEPSNNARKLAVAFLKNNRSGNSDRYHYLPGLCNLPDLLLDFQKVVVLQFAECRGLQCETSIASPFSESISSRFLHYIGRIGTPDIDTEFVINRLRRQMR